MQESEKVSLPTRLLIGVHWSLAGKPYPDRAAFNEAVRQYQIDITEKDTWNPDEVILRCGRVRVMYMCWEDGEQIEPILELTSDDGVAFRAGELLHKIHNGVVEQLSRIDHHYFEGLSGQANPPPGEAPLYWLRQGS